MNSSIEKKQFDLVKKILTSRKWNDKIAKQFCSFIKIRFPTELSPSYLQEWADRFEGKTAWAHADSESKTVLKIVGYGGD